MVSRKHKKNQTHAFDIIDEMEYMKEKTLSLLEMYKYSEKVV